MSILKGLNKGTTNKGTNLNTNVKIDGEKYRIFLRQSPKSPEMFSGSLYRGEKNEETGKREESYTLRWNVKKHAQVMIVGLLSDTEEGKELIEGIRKTVTDRILAVAIREEHAIAEQHSKFRGESTKTEEKVESNTTAEEETAISSDAPDVDTHTEDKEIVKQTVSNAKAYCNRLGVKSYSEGLEQAIIQMHAQQKHIDELTNKITILESKPAAERKLTKEEIDQIVYDNMPAEFASAPARVEELEEELSKLKASYVSLEKDLETAEDAYYAAANTIKDIQPEEKVEVEVPALDITAIKAEIKSELKAELLQELKAELKAQSPAPVVKEESKKEVKKEVKKETKVTEEVDSKLVLPGKTKKETKKPEVKTEAPKKKKPSEMTYEDIANADYVKLQKIGSYLKLGVANVAKKDELVILIAKKLKLTIPTQNKKESDTDTTIIKPQNNSSLASKRNSYVPTVDEELLDEIMDEDDSELNISSKSTVSSTDANKKILEAIEQQKAKFRNA